jgi:putative two-component system response regulator
VGILGSPFFSTTVGSVEHEHRMPQDEPSILIVDDSPENLSALSRLLAKQGYRARPMPRGEQVIHVAEIDPPDLILLDIIMPGLNGYEVCRQLKKNKLLRDIPVIFISGLGGAEDKGKAFRAGGVDYVTKPFHAEEVRARVETQLTMQRLRRELEAQNQRLEALVEERVKELSDSHMASIYALAKLAESRDDDTGKHLERVRTFCRLLALNLSSHSRYKTRIDAAFAENIFGASPLHDIGKVAIPDQILVKRGKLTHEEFSIMKSHANHGAQTLEAVRQRYPHNSLLNMGIAISRHHHEKWDGSGYPEGLAGEDIPLPARIMAVADVYDALSSTRCYKLAFSHEQSSEIIMQESGSHFDPDVVGAFAELNKEFEQSRVLIGN